MSLPRLRVLLALLIGSLAAAGPALAATRGSSVVERRVALLADEARTDAERVDAREYLVRRAAVAELIALGKQTKSTNVRMHVAIALARLKRSHGEIAAALPTLGAWLEEADPAVRYWSVYAIANAQTLEAVTLLEGAIKKAGEAHKAAVADLLAAQKKAVAARAAAKASKDETVTKAKLAEASAADAQATQAGARAQRLEPMVAAIARAVGMMGKNVADDKRRAILLSEHLAGNADSTSLRVAGIEGLRKWGDPLPENVKALFKVAREDASEEVWRAAIKTLQSIARIDQIDYMQYKAGVSKAERLRKLKVWESEWQVKQRAAAAS